MTHESLLHAYWRAHRIKPGTAGVPECVAAKMSEASGISGPLQFLLYSGVGIRQSPNLCGRSKNPILRVRELSCLLPDLEHFQHVLLRL